MWEGEPEEGNTHVSIIFIAFGFTFFFIPRCCSSRSRVLSFSWAISSLLKSYCESGWPNKLRDGVHICSVLQHDCLLHERDSLALLFDPVVLFFEVRRAGDMSRLFLREQLHVMLELLHSELRIGRLLLLCLDHLVQFTQLRVEPRQRRAFFLQSALRLAVLRL